MTSTSLGSRASRGVMVTVGGLWGRTFLQLLSTIALARLLDPADFGLVAIVMTLINFLDLFRDFGLSTAILQEREITDRQWSSLAWLSVALGTLLALGVAASAPLVADVFGDDRLVLVVIVASPTLFINGLMIPLQAKVQRDLRFGTLAAIDVVSMLVSVPLGIIAAAVGCGVWSLLIMAGSGLLWRLFALRRAAALRIGRPRIGAEVLPTLNVGGNMLGTQLLTYVVRNGDNVLIGHQMPAAVLGQYSRAYALFLLPMQQINGPLVRVALPVLGRLRDEPERFRRYIRSAFMVIGYLAFPVYAIAAAVSHPFVEVLLGPGWSQAATIFAILSLAGVAQVIANVMGWIYMSLGRTRQHFYASLVLSVCILTSYVVGLRLGGVEGLALAYGITSLAALLPTCLVAIHGTFVRLRDIVEPLARPTLIAPLCYVAASWASHAVGTHAALVQLLCGGAAGVGVAVAAGILPAVRRDIRAIVAIVRQARSSASPA